MTVHYYHVTYEFQSESTILDAWISKNSLLETGAISEVLSDSDGIRTYNHLVCKLTLNHLAKLAS